ncbi:MAG: hypothetical protein WBL95_06085 [Microcoleus sp.]
MTTILSQAEPLYQEQEEFAIVATTFKKREGQKFPSSRPIAPVRSVHSLRQTSTKDIASSANSYYLSPHLTGSVTVFLMPQPYELRTIDEQSEKLSSDDIAVHELARYIVGQNVGFVQTLASARRGKFLTPSTNPPSKSVPRSQPKFQKLEADADLEADEEEPFWRGVFVVPHQPKVLFRKEVEVKTNKLPTWKPNIIIDSYRLEDDDE